jgi:hypothetical protein
VSFFAGMILKNKGIIEMKTLMKFKIYLVIVFAIYGMALGQYSIVNNVFSNGSVLISDTDYSIKSILGQALIGKMNSSSYITHVGFWYSAKMYVNIGQREDQLPQTFQLFQNYPNPFNPITKIKYAVPQSSHIRLVIYNVLGQRISTLVNEDKLPGYYTVKFNANSLASGFYIYHLEAKDFQETRKMVLMR